MLKAFLYGAAAAIIGSKLKKMNDEGRLEPYKEQARKSAHQIKERLGEIQDKADLSGGLRSATRKARLSPDSSLSKPAPPHPWPIDPKALPSES